MSFMVFAHDPQHSVLTINSLDGVRSRALYHLYLFNLSYLSAKARAPLPPSARAGNPSIGLKEFC